LIHSILVLCLTVGGIKRSGRRGWGGMLCLCARCQEGWRGFCFHGAEQNILGISNLSFYTSCYR